MRLHLRALFADDPDFLVVTDSFMIGASNQQLFRDVTAASVFALAPRGNGASSFRIFAARRDLSRPPACPLELRLQLRNLTRAALVIF